MVYFRQAEGMLDEFEEGDVVEGLEELARGFADDIVDEWRGPPFEK